ncbi:tol-pal system protein YbgF [Sodalis endosymbiont of Henestaris halophilus]|uniref:tol-pal system protein YbgF n=1 Tax=Sodalis endosymbiont of Henestaris halophilus TaxID=1929246 RepID=UPI000BC0B741|nr:tol-pal system protein YbgF [Sodalis endosymbiont of Henestaris halophilus]SNC59100.1 tol-pal system protein YbgF [Sodalis endosymbiont of Henestaris halophilus]
MSNNFRPYILISLSLLVGTVPSWVTADQAPISHIGSGLVESRVTQLERITSAHSKLLITLQQQLADNYRDVDSLRGEIQENQYKLSQVIERQNQVYQQMKSLSSHALTVPKDSKLQASMSSSTVVVKSAELAAHAASTDYNEAVALVLEKKRYGQAIRAFKKFIKNYPDSIYQPNANYWLGQLNYNQGKKDDALYYFALVAKTYPKSSKAPDALLKVGMIMQVKGQNDKARAVYQQVGKLYPSAEAAKQAQKRLTGL